MSDPALQLALMKLLSTKHFPLNSPRRKVKLDTLSKAMEKIGTPSALDPLFENLCELKGRGYVNTVPKIILKEESSTAEFEVWLTPLGRTELEKKLAQ
ncbi:MAG: hypothetical protein AB7N76_23855 [Planctomycetota bacterium]